MRLLIQNNYDLLSKWVADYIADKIKKHQEKHSRPFVLGLPTGSSPIGTYRELIALHKNGQLSFNNVITFNMDEYVDLEETHPESYHSFMYHHFFDHIDIPRENINILDGNCEDLALECSQYEEKIKAVGGIDLFLGGIGTDGHIAFNEPGSSLSSRTRVKTLNTETRQVNSRFFDNDINKVPKLALTVGVGTVMDAKEVVVIVSGHQKARALHKAVEGGVSHMWTLSALQLHNKAMIVCDEDATIDLKVGTYKYFKDIERNNIEPEKGKELDKYLH
ncbi:glucosamine-6-phosphate deaminase [Echinicola sp. CAU 1574]|uniref:Glucosamine-6-phosphate deaminase n=1 Tax=Echinicola arenosa TaxID=2774144 RepID=A0ABR9AKY5_9BACT|nr:glucosamine-6-phosphate deaminase [Echinicola arenosa]MBD8488991.1 glucosamine-6-phosphate deaminase [Echinicola arenosa]